MRLFKYGKRYYAKPLVRLRCGTGKGREGNNPRSLPFQQGRERKGRGRDYQGREGIPYCSLPPCSPYRAAPIYGHVCAHMPHVCPHIWPMYAPMHAPLLLPCGPYMPPYMAHVCAHTCPITAPIYGLYMRAYMLH